jgi:hypothetical protein
MITQIIEKIFVAVMAEEIGHHRAEGTNSDA